MVRSLTTSASAAKELTYVAFDWLVESTAVGLKYATNPSSTLLSTGYVDRMETFSPITFSAPPGGGLASVGNVTISAIDNNAGQSPSALFNSNKIFEGKALNLKLMLSGESYVNAVNVFSGVIDQTSRRGIESLIVAVDETLPLNFLYPTKVVPASDPNAARSAVNRAAPTVYGDSTRVGQAPMLLTDKTNRQYRFAGHKFRTASTASDVAVFDLASNMYKSHSGDKTVNSTEGVLQMGKPLPELRFGSETASLSIAGHQDADNLTNAIDGSTGTFALIGTNTQTNADGDGYGFLRIRGTFTDPEGATRLKLTVSEHRGSSGAAATLTGQFTLRITDTGGTVVHDDLWKSQEFRHTSNPRTFTEDIQGFALSASQRVELLIEAINEGGVGSTGDTESYEVGDVTMTLSREPVGLEETLFLSGNWQGRADDTGGSITGTSGALVTNPADVVRSVILKDLVKTVSTGAFDSARTSLSSWTFDGGVGAGWHREQTDIRDLLNTMGLQSKSVVFVEDGASWTMTPFNAASTSVYDFDADSIFWEPGAEEAPPEARRSSVEVRYGRLADVFNSFEIRYAYNPGSQKFDRSRFVTPTGSNSAHADAGDLVILCANSQTRYGDLRQLVIEADFIYDNDTAEFLLDHVVRYFWNQRVTVEFDTGMQALHVQLADMITVDDVDLPVALQGAKFEVHGIQLFDSGRHRIQASRSLEVDFDYVCIKDQNNQTWYWWMERGPELTVSTAAPSFLGLNANDITQSTIPHWLEIDDADTVTRYISPGTSTSQSPGEPTISTASLPVGIGQVASTGLTFTATHAVEVSLTVSTTPELTLEF